MERLNKSKKERQIFEAETRTYGKVSQKVTKRDHFLTHIKGPLKPNLKKMSENDIKSMANQKKKALSNIILPSGQPFMQKKKQPEKNIFIADRDAPFNMKEDVKIKHPPSHFNQLELPVFDTKTINILLNKNIKRMCQEEIDAIPTIIKQEITPKKTGIQKAESTIFQ